MGYFPACLLVVKTNLSRPHANKESPQGHLFLLKSAQEVM